MNYREIETKYNAEHILLTDFIKFCIDRQPDAVYTASGFDRFYDNQLHPDSFCRHRVEPDKFNELSFKKKLTDKNNNIRVEHNIRLSVTTTAEQIEALCKEFGFVYNTSLFKNCFIYKYPRYTLVYYICYDEALKEKGRFIEIEMDEEHDWAADQQAWDELTEIESTLKPLGISPQARVRRSLFEMFREEK